MAPGPPPPARRADAGRKALNPAGVTGWPWANDSPGERVSSAGRWGPELPAFQSASHFPSGSVQPGRWALPRRPFGPSGQDSERGQDPPPHLPTSRDRRGAGSASVHTAALSKDPGAAPAYYTPQTEARSAASSWVTPRPATPAWLPASMAAALALRDPAQVSGRPSEPQVLRPRPQAPGSGTGKVGLVCGFPSPFPFAVLLSLGPWRGVTPSVGSRIPAKDDIEQFPFLRGSGRR